MVEILNHGLIHWSMPILHNICYKPDLTSPCEERPPLLVSLTNHTMAGEVLICIY